MGVIQTAINGGLDTNNLSPTAGILLSQIANPTWTAITLAAGMGVNTTCQAFQFGTVVFASGSFKNATGSTVGGFSSPLGTLPFHPPAQRWFSCVQISFLGTTVHATVRVNTDGTFVTDNPLQNNDFLTLDGIVYSMVN